MRLGPFLTNLRASCCPSSGMRPGTNRRCSTERQPYLLYNADGVAIAELVDDRVAVIDDGVEVERYREIEVEALVDDAPLDGIVDALIAAGATRSYLSKAAAALGPDADGPPDVLEPADVRAQRQCA